MNNNKNSRSYLTVSGLNRYLSAYIAQDVQLNNVLVKGELSNVAYTSQGHIYFTLKEDNSVIKCVVFRSLTSKIKFKLEDGMSVFAEGRVGIYEGSSTYNIYVKDVQLDGIGALYQQYEDLKKKLAQEGLFDQSHKLPIPSMPSRVAILCGSPTAAQADIYRTIKNRFPFCQMFFFPVKVSGKQAVEDIITTLNNIRKYNFPLVIISRGGGSFEDLFCFNDERLARTIYDYPIPIITGIGHETDTTIADFVADLRAATPTAAAVAATVDVNKLLVEINSNKNMLLTLMDRLIKKNKEQLRILENSYVFKNPDKIYASSRLTLDHLTNKLFNLMDLGLTKSRSNYGQMHNRFVNISSGFVSRQKNIVDRNQLILNQLLAAKLNKSRSNLDHSIVNLDNLSPLKIMTRGYSIVEKDDSLVKSVKQLSKDDEVSIRLSDGKVKARVE